MIKVMFRMEKNSRTGEEEALAIFPELPGTNDPATCLCYAHRGQHSSADTAYAIRATRLAKPTEYAALLAELRAHGYVDLRIVTRTPAGAYVARWRAVHLQEASK